MARFLTARFDVYANQGQHAQMPAVKRPERLMRIVSVLGEECVLETPKMAAVPLRALKAPVASLAENQADITAALDFLFNGY